GRTRTPRVGVLGLVSSSSRFANNKRRKRNAGKRRVVLRTQRGAAPSQRGRLAFRRPTTALPKGCVVPWCDPGQASRENHRSCGRVRRRPSRFQRRTSHTGRNAGGLDARTARERVQLRPRAPTLAPPLRAAPVATSFTGRDDSPVFSLLRDECQEVVSRRAAKRLLTWREHRPRTPSSRIADRPPPAWARPCRASGATSPPTAPM